MVMVETVLLWLLKSFAAVIQPQYSLTKLGLLRYGLSDPTLISIFDIDVFPKNQANIDFIVGVQGPLNSVKDSFPRILCKIN